MNVAIWVLAGGVIGWVGYRFLGVNGRRRVITAIVIGAVGGYCGGSIIAPMFTAPGAVPAEFSSFALFFAAMAAAAFLFAGNLVHERWGV